MTRRLFDATLRIRLSGEEAVLIKNYLKETAGKKAEIGHLLEEVAQNAIDALAAQAVMYSERKDA